MNSNQKTKFREILVETLQAFDKFCKQHNLHYFAAYGTVIGAVRHHGFIPWDDDIDVYMPKDDYIALLALKNNINKFTPPYKIVDHEDRGYYLPFAKFYDGNTCLQEYWDDPYRFGVYIDIFPLYETNDRIAGYYKEIYRQTWSKYRQGISKHSFARMREVYQKKGRKWGLIYLRGWTFYKLFAIYYYNKFKRLEQKLRTVRGNKYISYAGPYGDEIFPKEWFAETLLMKFEKYDIPLPKMYDEYLRSLYGDYMQLPPVEKRITHHDHYYLDLDNPVKKGK